MGIYWILEMFPSMRRSFDPTRTMILPPSQPAKLPFLPNSAWMSDGTIRIAEDATGDTNNFETLEEKDGLSLKNSGAGPFTPKRSKHVEALLPVRLLQASTAPRTSVKLVVLPKEHPRRDHKARIALGKCSFVEGNGRQSWTNLGKT